MESFCKLLNPAGYVACSYDLTADGEGRGHWAGFFKRHFHTILGLGVEADLARGGDAGEVRERAAACLARFDERFDAFAARPGEFGRVTVLTFDAWRDGCLREFGFGDPFVDKKHQANEQAIALLGEVCRELDELAEGERARALVEGIFAGNIFDMGSEATAKDVIAGAHNFFDVRDRLAKRPWLFDDFDRLVEKLHSSRRYRKVVYFIDNAGSDWLLGGLPFMRWMAMRGTKVVLAANELATLNDMTIGDVREWWGRAVKEEPSLGELAIELVSTGTGEPLIDLGAVSVELNAAAADADLVVLEGMGRAVESNLDAKLNCDVLKIAMVKDSWVARKCGGRVYDLVCRVG